MGKTELAFAYAHAFASEYLGGRFLIACQGHTDLRSSLLQLEPVLEVPAARGDETALQDRLLAISNALRRRVEDLGHVLLVFDNLESFEPCYADCFDALLAIGPKLHILVTTRGLRGNPFGAELELTELSTASSIALLEKHRHIESDEDREAAMQIAEELAGFPIALELVGCWLSAHPGTTRYSDLPAFLDLQSLEEMAEDDAIGLRRHNHEKRLSRILWPIIRDLPDMERRILIDSCLLGPDRVPLAWLRDLRAGEPTEALAARTLIPPWATACERLESLSLFSHGDGDPIERRIVRVHRLIRSMVLEHWATDVETAQTRVVEMLERKLRELESIRRSAESRREVESLAAAISNMIESDVMDGARLASWLFEPLREASLISIGQEIVRKASELMTRESTVDAGEFSYSLIHPGQAVLLSDLAIANQMLGNASAARTAMAQAQEVARFDEQADPPQAALRLSAASNLADSVEERRMLLSRANQVSEAAGNDFPEAIRMPILRKLALAEKDLGHYEAARAHLATVEAMESRLLTSTDPHRLSTLTNRGLIEHEARDHELAEKFLTDAFEQSTRILGQDHPRTANAATNLARLLWDRREWDRATDLCEESLRVWEASDHALDPKRGKAFWVQGLAARRRGDEVGAKRLLADASQLLRRLHPDDHPWIVRLEREMAYEYPDPSNVDDHE
jgi:hypothetical protein